MNITEARIRQICREELARYFGADIPQPERGVADVVQVVQDALSESSEHILAASNHKGDLTKRHLVDWIVAASPEIRFVSLWRTHVNFLIGDIGVKIRMYKGNRATQRYPLRFPSHLDEIRRGDKPQQAVAAVVSEYDQWLDRLGAQLGARKFCFLVVRYDQHTGFRVEGTELGRLGKATCPLWNKARTRPQLRAKLEGGRELVFEAAHRKHHSGTRVSPKLAIVTPKRQMIGVR